jgi:hypothetical protein
VLCLGIQFGSPLRCNGTLQDYQTVCSVLFMLTSQEVNLEERRFWEQGPPPWSTTLFVICNCFARGC